MLDEIKSGIVSSLVLKKISRNNLFNIQDLSDRTLRGLFASKTNIQQGSFVLSNRNSSTSPELCVSVYNYVLNEYKIQKICLGVDQFSKVYSKSANMYFQTKQKSLNTSRSDQRLSRPLCPMNAIPFILTCNIICIRYLIQKYQKKLVILGSKHIFGEKEFPYQLLMAKNLHMRNIRRSQTLIQNFP